MALAKPQTTTTAATDTQQQDELTQEGVQATAEQEQVSEAPQAEEKQDSSKAVAATPVTEKAVAASSKFEQSMAEQGFEGLSLGGMSFEQICLPAEGQFLIGQDDEELGKEFDCVIQSTRARFVVRQSDDTDAEMFYSYDPNGLTNTEGKDMADTLQEWKEDGYETPVIKKYIEVMAVMVNSEERDGMMVMLSVSPASTQKLAGFIAQQQFMKKQQPNEFITRCVVGKKVKGNNGNAFYPWTFKNAGEAPELL